MYKRLTDKNADYYKFRVPGVYGKLCDIEDMEEELGIDLVTLMKAFIHGIYYKENFMGGVHYVFAYPELTFVHDEDSQDDIMVFKVSGVDGEFYMYEYGKFWALTRKELEEND